jgi:hypothetical protein
MFSSSNRSSTRVGRVFVGVVLALLSMAIFAGLEAFGAERTVTRVTAAALTAADSAGTEPQILGVVSRFGREAVRVLTTMITAVFEGWRQPVDAALDWVDGIRRGWTAVHRFPGAATPRS